MDQTQNQILSAEENSGTNTNMKTPENKHTMSSPEDHINTKPPVSQDRQTSIRATATSAIAGARRMPSPNPVTNNPVTNNPVTNNPVTNNPVTNNPNRQKKMKNSPNIEITPLEVQKLAASLVRNYATLPVRDDLITHRELVCASDEYLATCLADHTDEVERKQCDYLACLPTSELAKPRAVRYYCLELGSVLALIIKSTAYFRLSDIAALAGVTPQKLRDYICADQFATLSLCGAGDTTDDFVCWKAAALFCISTPKGRLLIAWVEQVILDDLFGQFGPARAIRARFLHALIPSGLIYPAWNDNFRRQYPGVVPEGSLSSEDFDIPVALAKQFALENFHLFGLLAYVLIREVEEPSGAGVHESVEDLWLVCVHLQPNHLGQIDARVLHLFLKSKMAFDVWFLKMVEGLGLVDGSDYFTDPSNGISCNPLVSIEAAGNIGMVAATDRGRLIREYFSSAPHGASSRLHPQAGESAATTHSSIV